MTLYQRTVDYCPDDSVQVLPKYHRDYVPGNIDPVTLTPRTPPHNDDEHDLSKIMPPKLEAKPEPKPDGFKCNICGYECATERGMQTHVGKNHKKEKPEA